MTVRTTSNLNLRRGPGTNYNVLLVIPKDAAVSLDGTAQGIWQPVLYNGRSGYVSNKYLTGTEEPPMPADPTEDREIGRASCRERV